MLEYWELTLQHINIEGCSLAPNAGKILQAVTKDLDAGDGPAVSWGAGPWLREALAPPC